MFSFFKSKKPSPSSSPESEPMSGPPSGPPNDFVLIENRNDRPAQPGLYPSFGPSPSQPYAYPAPSYPPTMPATQPTATAADTHPTSYLHGVPFKLSSDLSTNDTSEITKIQIDDILSTITSKMHVSRPDYDFALERSTIAQSAAE